MKSARRSAFLLIAGSALATAAFFYRVVFTSDLFIGRDVLRGVYPLKQYWATRVAAGELPEWFPYDGLGQPFVGMMVSAVFHPTNLLFLILPLGSAQKLATLVCYPFAFLGAFVWVRRFGLGVPPAVLAGVAFAASGYLIGISNNTPYLMAAATLPWVFWAADRFLHSLSIWAALGTSALLALVLAAGEPQTFALACGFTLLAPFSRPAWRAQPLGRLAAVAGTLVLASLLSAPLLFPAAGLFSEITAAARPLDVALTWSVHPLQLLEVAFGSLYAGTPGSPVTAAIDQNLLQLGKSDPWVESAHLGLPILLLAGVGLLAHRKRATTWILCGIIGVLTLLALGKSGGLYELVFNLIPFWRPFRYPAKLLALLVLFLAISAATGLEAIAGSDQIRRRASTAFASAGLLSAALFVLELRMQLFSEWALRPLWSAAAPPGTSERLGSAFQTATVQSAVVCGMLFLILVGVSRARLRAGLVPLAVAIHLFVVNEPHYQAGSSRLLSTTPAFVERIRGLEGPPRLGQARVVDVTGAQQLPEQQELSWLELQALAMTDSLTSDTQLLSGLEGASPLMPATSARYVRLCTQKSLWLWRYAALFNTGYATIPTQSYRASGGDPAQVLAENLFEVLLVKTTQLRPRAYLAQPRYVPDSASALEALGSPEGVGADEAVIEEIGTAQPPRAPLGSAQLVSYAPEHVELRAAALSASVLVLNDAYYKGWTATVDGIAAPILPANYAVRAVELPPGEHSVIFSYRTPGLTAGLATAAAALLGTALVGFVLGRRRAGRR
jgi:hypothetical protein